MVGADPKETPIGRPRIDCKTTSCQRQDPILLSYELTKGRIRLHSWNRLVSTLFTEDVEALFQSGWPRPSSPWPLTVTLLLIRHPGLRAILLHRTAHWASVAGIPWLPTLIANLNLTLHGFDIVPAVTVGGGLYTPHTVGSVINARSIGKRVTLQGSITIGLKTDPVFPTIEDHVTLGAGCRVLGGITIGAGAIIGANAVVLIDVPPGKTAVGVPARVLDD